MVLVKLTLIRLSLLAQKQSKGRNIILATGSKVSRIDIPGIDSQLVMTSDDILDLRELPKSLGCYGWWCRWYRAWSCLCFIRR